MEMQWTPLQSSNLAAMAYDPDTQTLAVEFKGGGRYQHDGVPPQVADGLRTAESAGKYYHLFLRNEYNVHKI